MRGLANGCGPLARVRVAVRMLLSSAMIGIRTVGYAYDGDLLPLVVNPVQNAIGAAACATAIIQRWPELLAHPARITEQRTDDKLIGSKCDRFGKVLGQLLFRSRRNDQLISPVGHVLIWNRFCQVGRGKRAPMTVVGAPASVDRTDLGWVASVSLSTRRQV